MTERPRLLLATSNGAGMGHLTRQAAVALAAGSGADVTIFSLSVALPVLDGLGLGGEYCPSPERGWMPIPNWHGYLADRIVAIVRELDIDLVAFDGVAPYPGIGRAHAELRSVPFVWFRRGMWRAGTNVNQMKKGAYFDLIIEPGDLAASADRGPTAGASDATLIPPITMCDVVPAISRAEAAAALGVSADRPTALVTLGSGRLGAVEAPGAIILEALLAQTDFQVCVTKAAVATKNVAITDRTRITELAGVYPLVRHLAAFDVAVSAAGYNATHEFLPSAIPTLLVPNPSTATDDQVGRARRLADDGLALMAMPDSPQGLQDAVVELSRAPVRRRLTDSCQALPPSRRSGGAAAAAELLIRLAAEFEPERRTLRDVGLMASQRAREAAKDVLGPERSDRLRVLLGRDPVRGRASRMRVRPTTDPYAPQIDGEPTLLFGDTVPADRMMSGDPVEHLVSGSSAAYRDRRREIADEYYDLIQPGA